VSEHPVLRVLRERAARDDGAGPGRYDDGARLALVVEGGGMRGAVSGGMGLALHRAGLTNCFDAAYGSSAGALGAAWLMSGGVEAGLRTYFDRDIIKRVIRPARAFGPGPLVDMDHMIGTIYERVAPGFFELVLASSVELHPLATDVETGQPVDLHATIGDVPTLRDALRATSRLPLMAGPPVAVDGRRYVDAGLSSAIPFRAALDDGATHVLLLRSRRAGDRTVPPGRASGAMFGRMLRRLGPEVAATYLSRAQREGEDEDELERCAADPSLEPSILAIQTPADAPTVSRLERDPSKLGPALDAGEAAARATLGDLAGPATQIAAKS
jgi:predicted patatin/cPLA2 family phospholipase